MDNAVTVERWLPVVGFEGWYEVSDMGHVRRVGRLAYLKPTTCHGYYSVCLSVQARPSRHILHRLVLTAFSGPCPDGMEAAHYNGIKTDNRIENLRWASHRENVEDNHRLGRYQLGTANKAAKLTPEIVATIRALPRWRGMKARLARKYGVGETAIREVLAGTQWAHVR